MRAGSLVVAGTLISACAAFAAEPMAPNDIQATFFNGKPFTASTTSGTQFKMIFTPDGKMTREPRGKSGKKNSGTWKLDTQGFCTTWKRAETNCYTIVPSGKNKWSVQKGSTALAVGPNNQRPFPSPLAHLTIIIPLALSCLALVTAQCPRAKGMGSVPLGLLVRSEGSADKWLTHKVKISTCSVAIGRCIHHYKNG
jgi:hypothetical protein